MSTKPFFRADQVGSLLRPQKLLDARTRWKAGNMSLNGLRALEDEAIAECVKMQENLLLVGRNTLLRIELKIFQTNVSHLRLMFFD